MAPVIWDQHGRAEVLRSVGQSVELTDLKGYTLLPGLIDSHTHPIGGGLSLITANAGEELESIEELAALAAEAKETGKDLRGEILYVSGIPLVLWSKITQLNAVFNSGTYAQQPVFFRGMDYHTGWANREMLHLD